ncbi:hypothetical protein HNP55_001161 [Paucibacter oligotrophus]|uniref:Uncharacterized protein n=1 Tax=Roseateles oligotrophus TaxID=1769250 RepID=A0A840L3W6_9BURK|nr:hypothetical protein [Roseateles oligotrophus]
MKRDEDYAFLVKKLGELTLRQEVPRALIDK